jgi:arginase
MTNRVLISPYVLAEPSSSIGALARRGDAVNQAVLDGDTLMARVSSVHRPLAAWVADTARSTHRPVCLAGDCCASIAMLAGLQRAGLDPVLVWLDAHGDFNTFETTISGFIGGMPLAMIAGRGDQSLIAAAHVRPLDEADIVLCDARDLDPAERQAVAGSRVHHESDPDRIVGHLPEARPIHVHFDTDVLDPAFAPAMKYPSPGGLSEDAARRMMQALAATGRLAAVSMTVWDMEKDTDRRTARACLSMLSELVGEPMR